MAQNGTRAVLWANVLELTQTHYGKENLTRLAREIGIGPGTATRIKEQATRVGLDTLEKLRERFGVQPWQLLVPGFEPGNPPALMPVSASERMLWDRLLSAARELRDAEKWHARSFLCARPAWQHQGAM